MMIVIMLHVFYHMNVYMAFYSYNSEIYFLENGRLNHKYAI